jgi:hypothetical protein
MGKSQHYYSLGETILTKDGQMYQVMEHLTDTDLGVVGVWYRLRSIEDGTMLIENQKEIRQRSVGLGSSQSLSI